MNVVGIIKQKGGAGATTTAVHLALAAAKAGQRVVIADTDPQRSAVAWARIRGGDDVPVIGLEAGDLKAFLRDAQADGYTLALIDTAPRHDADTAAAARASDLCLIPTKCAPFDLAALGPTIRLVQSVRRPGVVVLTTVPRDGSEGAEARAAAAEYGMEVWSEQLSDLKAYRTTIRTGRTVMDPMDRRDWRGLDLATAEVGALWRLAADRLGL